MRSTNSGEISGARPIVTKAADGVPPIAAMSLRQRASALWPIFSGGVSLVKWMPSTTASVLNKSCRLKLAALQHRAIVTRADDDGVVRRQRAGEAGNEFKLVHDWAGSLSAKSLAMKNST
jgi:hypothetical protein